MPEEEFDSYKAGNVFRWDAFNSTSYSRDIAEGFLTAYLGVLYVIHGQTQTGFDISRNSHFAEDEVLFLPGSKFLITKVNVLAHDAYGNPNQVEVHCQQFGSLDDERRKKDTYVPTSDEFSLEKAMATLADSPLK